jgi:hypothetical protein
MLYTLHHTLRTQFYKLSYNLHLHIHYFFIGESVPQMKEALGQEMKEVKEGKESCMMCRVLCVCVCVCVYSHLSSLSVS